MADKVAKPTGREDEGKAELKLTIAPRVIVCQDTNLSGEISISTGTVLHPLCSILALGGPIVIGSNCILEEKVTLINSSSSGQPLIIGSSNHFEVGARIEVLPNPAALVQVGDWNTFEIKSNIIASRGEVKIGKWTKIGVGVVVDDSTQLEGYGRPEPTQEELEAVLRVGLDEEDEMEQGKGGRHSQKGNSLAAHEQVTSKPSSTGGLATTAILEEDEEAGEDGLDNSSAAKPATECVEVSLPSSASPLIIPDYSVLYSAEASHGNAGGGCYRVHTWSGEGILQEEAAFAKHLEYLREVLPRLNKLRKI